MPDEPIFAAPWQAHAVALVVALQDAGVFSGAEWAATLGAERAAPDATADGGDSFDHWVAALAHLLTIKAVATTDEIEALTAGWQRAAHATPHGHPIELANDPLRSGRRPAPSPGLSASPRG